MKTKEIIWFVTTIAMVTIINFYFLGLDSLNANATLDINIHDTYFVISSINFFVLFAVLLFFLVYTIRMLVFKYENITINCIAILSNITLSIVCIYVMCIVSLFGKGKNHISEANDPVGDAMHVLFYMLLIFQILLLLFLAYSGFRTGITYNKKRGL